MSVKASPLILKIYSVSHFHRTCLKAVNIHMVMTYIFGARPVPSDFFFFFFFFFCEICRFYLMDAPYSKWVKATKKMFSGCLPYLVMVTNLNVNSFLEDIF